MNEELMKSLVSLIDESLAELDELKKSDRFSASEIKLGGPGEGLAGKDPQGSLGKEDKDSDKDDEDEDEDKEDKKDMDKAEGKNSEADPNAGHHKAVAKGEMSAGSSDGSNTGSAAGSNREADPNGGHHKAVSKAEDKKDDDKDEDKKKKDKEDMKKALDDQSTLIKSYVDQKFSTFEDQLGKIAKLVQEIADTPVPSKSVSYKGIAPLKKSEDEASSALTKTAVVDKLFELKKSGKRVDSVDITSAELGSPTELAKIANKYNIK